MTDQRREPIATDPQAVAEAAARVGLVIPDACLPGVIANGELLARHRAVVLGVLLGRDRS